MNQSLSTYRGDTYSLSINFTDENAVAIDITGWTLFFTVKSRKTDTDAQAIAAELPVKTITIHSNPTGGQTVISLTASETNSLSGKYYYDIQYKKPDGTIKTFLKGVINFTEDITRRVS
jgi:hypothetical protein